MMSFHEMMSANLSDDVVFTSRILEAGADEVFAAFGDAKRLARWWGPEGFTNTFHEFDFREGGRWVFVMHAPNGSDFANECVFREIRPGARIVIEHVVKPRYLLTVLLEEEAGGTCLSWHQKFESESVAAAMRKLAETANEQVLDRLEAVLADREFS